MDPNLKVALAGAAGLVIGSLITVVIAPHINWGNEKKRQKLARRSSQIDSWRKMIEEIARQRGTSGTLAELLERRSEFHSLKRHLSQNTIKDIYASTTFIVGTTIDTGLTRLSEEVGRLEKEWKLV